MIDLHFWADGSKREPSLVHLGQSIDLVLSIPACKAAHLELQTSTQRTALIEAAGPSSGELQCHWEVKELGVHVLACRILPLDAAEEVRKYFKFTAASPFVLRTKVQEAAGACFVEAQLSNASVCAFRIDRIAFDDSTASGSALGTGYEGPFELKPRCSHQFLFQLASPSLLGRLDIRWSTEAGETGHLQTAPIAAPPVQRPSLEVQCTPGENFSAMTPGTLRFLFTNNTLRRLNEVHLTMETSGEFVPIGEPLIQLPFIEPGATASASLTVIPVFQGPACSRQFTLGYLDEWVKHRLTQELFFISR